MRIFLLLAVLLVSVNTGFAEGRVALVIGNSDYTKITKLRNPENDAALMASTLRRIGFEVTTLFNADQKTMKKAMLTFTRGLRDTDAVGLFYYAGHGVQVDREN